MNKFDSWSKWYDFINRTKMNNLDDLEFYQKLLDDYGEPGLELACGTGRLLVENIKQGYNVHGLDISQQMIETTKKKLLKNNLNLTTLYKQDVRKLNIDEKYPVIYYPFNSLTHFTTVEDQINVFNNIYDIVEDDGIFAFDIYVPDIEVMNNYGDLTRFKREYNNIIYIIEIWEEWKSTSEQIFTQYNRVINNETNEIEWQTKFNLSILPKQQLELLLIDSGFEDYEFYDGFTSEPLKHNSERMSVIAKK